MSLTDMQIKKLKPKKSRFEVLDSKGLYIRVTPGGHKSWVFRYNFNGIPRRLTLGSHTALSLESDTSLTLAEAREKHAQAMQDIAKGLDPGAKVQALKAAIKASPTIKDMVNELFEKELTAKKSGTETKRLLDKDVVSQWGTRKVADIKRRDVVLLLDGITDRGAPIGRNRVHSALTRLFNFAAERGVIDDSPCLRIRKIQEESRERVLNDTEIKLYYDALSLENKDIDIYWQTKLALKMQLLTGQRSSEIAGMTWDEIDLEQNTWLIPASRMKNNTEHKLPLTQAMRGLLQTVKSMFGNDTPYIFPSPIKRNRDIAPTTAHALSKAILRHRDQMGIQEPFTPHDIRRTVRTKLAELQIDELIAERVLGHKLQGIAAVYNRYDYLQEKLNALETWEKALIDIAGFEVLENEKVINIRGFIK